MNKMRTWIKEARAYVPHIAVLLVVWGLVPAMAKLGKMDGLQATFWVNLFAALMLLLLVPVVNLFKKRKGYTKITTKDLPKMFLLGLIYPFVFSVLYFQAIYLGSPTLTQIIGRTNILIYAPLAVYVFKVKTGLAKRDILLMFITVLAVAIGLAGKVNIIQTMPSTIAMALGAAVCYGAYNAVAEKWKESYDPLNVTLIIEIVSAMVSFLLILAFSKFVIPVGFTLMYLLVIGVLANGIGFWLYMEGFQKAAKLPHTSHKVVFLVSLSGVLTILQAIIISITGAESISISLWIGLLVLVSGLTWYGVSGATQK